MEVTPDHDDVGSGGGGHDFGGGCDGGGGGVGVGGDDDDDHEWNQCKRREPEEGPLSLGDIHSVLKSPNYI